MRDALILAILLLTAACGRQEAKPESGVSESWSLIHLDGQRAGHVHSVRTVKAGEVETSVQSRMKMRRMGQDIVINSNLKQVETVDGKPLRFSSLMEMSAQPTVREGVIENGKLRLTTTSGGNTTVKEMDWDPEWLLSEGTRLMSRKKGFAPGTKYKYKSFNADYGAAEEVDVEVVDVETKKVLGEDRKLARVRAKFSIQKGVVSTTWVDDKGEEQITEVAAMGLKILMEACTKEEALKDASGELPEVFFQTMPRSNLALPRPRDITALTVRLERPEAGFSEWKPPEATQKVLGRDAKSVTLAIAPLASGGPVEDRAIYLKPSPGVQCDDAEIVQAAKEVAGDEKDPARLAGKLAGWVHERIDKKSMDIGAASAKEVFKNRSGDCSEHAVLLAAMLRAAGIPAKVCCGYLYFRGSWGGHAWTSAWVGRWVDYDATLGAGPADAARIKFSETDGEDAGAIMEGMRGAGFMHGGMKIDVLEYAIDGRAVKAAPFAPPAGNRFEAPLLGVSFEKPEGWTFRDAKDLPPFTLAVIGAPEGDSRAVVSYIDLSYDAVKLDTKKAARKLGASSSGELGKLEERETYETDSRFYVRLSPGEVLEVVLKGDEAVARPALAQIKKTMKITR